MYLLLHSSDSSLENVQCVSTIQISGDAHQGQVVHQMKYTVQVIRRLFSKIIKQETQTRTREMRYQVMSSDNYTTPNALYVTRVEDNGRLLF